VFWAASASIVVALVLGTGVTQEEARRRRRVLQAWWRAGTGAQVRGQGVEDETHERRLLFCADPMFMVAMLCSWFPGHSAGRPGAAAAGGNAGGLGNGGAQERRRRAVLHAR
jgi:hypothetical protein